MEHGRQVTPPGTSHRWRKELGLPGEPAPCWSSLAAGWGEPELPARLCTQPALTDGSQARPSPTRRTSEPLLSPGKGLRAAAPLGLRLRRCQLLLNQHRTSCFHTKSASHSPLSGHHAFIKAASAFKSPQGCHSFWILLAATGSPSCQEKPAELVASFSSLSPIFVISSASRLLCSVSQAAMPLSCLEALGHTLNHLSI